MKPYALTGANKELRRIRAKWQDRYKDERADDYQFDLSNLVMIVGEQGFVSEFQDDLFTISKCAANHDLLKIVQLELSYWQSVRLLDSYQESYSHSQHIKNVKILLSQFLNRLDFIELYS
jgi:hypothetical protein